MINLGVIEKYFGKEIQFADLLSYEYISEIVERLKREQQDIVKFAYLLLSREEQEQSITGLVLTTAAAKGMDISVAKDLIEMALVAAEEKRKRQSFKRALSGNSNPTDPIYHVVISAARKGQIFTMPLCFLVSGKIKREISTIIHLSLTTRIKNANSVEELDKLSIQLKELVAGLDRNSVYYEPTKHNVSAFLAEINRRKNELLTKSIDINLDKGFGVPKKPENSAYRNILMRA